MIYCGQKSPGGFTLVELLIGATLSGMVMAAVLSSYIFLGRSFTRLSNQQILESEARRTLTYFAKDVQAATGISGTPSANRVALVVPIATNTNTVTYYYNSTASNAVVVVNGSNITMVGNALTRCVYNGTTVTSLVLLRNITGSGFAIKYYDRSGNEYPSATLSAGSYLTGIRQLALEFSTQTGVSANGTQTQVYRVASSRLLIRNSPLLQ